MFPTISIFCSKMHRPQLWKVDLSPMEIHTETVKNRYQRKIMTTGNQNLRNYILFLENKQLRKYSSGFNQKLFKIIAWNMLTDPTLQKGHRTFKIILQIEHRNPRLRENIQLKGFSIGWFAQVSSYYGDLAVTGLLTRACFIPNRPARPSPQARLKQ